jgi:hypothetical protein
LQAQTSDGRKPGISFRIQPEIKAALEKAATDDHRSISSLVEKVLAEWLRQHGYLPK